MKKIIFLITALLASIGMMIPAFAANDPDAVIDESRKGVIYIDYKDDVEGVDAIANAEFTAYKIALITESGSYMPIISELEGVTDESDPKEVLATAKKAYESEAGVENGNVYKTVTNAKGQASFQAMEQGLYLVEESTPAVEHFSANPFIVSMPYKENNIWVYSITVEPKAQPAGDLIISKTVRGINGDKNKDFHFKVEFEHYDEPVHYVKNNGTEGTIKSGDTIALKHNESATLDTIPVGTRYSVTEVEADKDGYTTTSTGSVGNIMRTVKMRAFFTNTADVPDTGDNYIAYITGGIALITLFISMTLLIKSGKKEESRSE